MSGSIGRAPAIWFDGYVFDLDGTIYLGDFLLPTVGETVLNLRERGKKIVFISNNPTRRREDYATKLTSLGIPTASTDILTSSNVMADFLRARLPGARLFVVGEEPLRAELSAAGFELTEEARRTEAVIASFDRTFDYRKLQIAFDAIRAGARFFATNADRFCPVAGGGEPDAAAMIAAIEACTNVRVEEVVGKPSRFMIDAALKLLELPPENCVITGDRIETDVKMGLAAGMATALVLTGATNAAALGGSGLQPNFVIEQLEELLPI